MLLLCATFGFSIPAFAAEAKEETVLELTGEAAIVIDKNSSEILYQKNSDTLMHPASITKIVTALLVLEHADLEDTVTVSQSAVTLMAGSTTAGFAIGEELRVEDALYALMIGSANDAANVLAEHVAGSQEAFAALMNERVKELGALNTNFTNAHGLPSSTHRTTAHDMALITRGALSHPEFLAYFGAPYHTMGVTNKANVTRSFRNHHSMLLESDGLYSADVIGGKTGYTVAAGSTLVTVAKQGEQVLICVVLKSSSAGKFADTQQLLAYGFEAFVTYRISTVGLEPRVVPVIGKGEVVGEATLAAPDDLWITLPVEVEPNFLLDYVHPPTLPDEGDLINSHLQVRLESEVLLEVPVEYRLAICPPVRVVPVEEEATQEVEGGLEIAAPEEAATGKLAVHWTDKPFPVSLLVAISRILRYAISIR